jgi:hypothetical protein
VAQRAARAIGWLFVAVIAYHAVRAWGQAERAVSDGDWGHAAVVVSIALVATFVVIAAIVTALRASRAGR